jgi:antitoxin component HigA of HigAB toxin-antitoxin module
VREIEGYFEEEPKRGTPEADRFELLARVIEDYERRRWPIDPPDAVDAARKPVKLAGLKTLTDGLSTQSESAGDFVRAMRDSDRY